MECALWFLAHLMMAEQAETCSTMTLFKKDLILSLDIVACWTVNKTESSNTNCNRMLIYKIMNHELLLVHPLIMSS
jgi:hypothetical protein